jgi:hypothetical protein
VKTVMILLGSYTADDFLFDRLLVSHWRLPYNCVALLRGSLYVYCNVFASVV